MFGFDMGDQDEDFQHQPEGEVNTQELYDILGVEKTATKEQIKKAFRKKATTAHPDKGGDAEQFNKIAKAYEILSDDEKRQTYDKYGEEGLKRNNGISFEEMFFGKKQDGGYKKAKSKRIELEVSLEDIYNGKMMKTDIKVKKICEQCNGQGGSDAKKCTDCDGRQIKQRLIQLGPGMYTQQMAPCETCRAKGVIFDDDKICNQCQGQRILDANKSLDVVIEKGTPDEYIYKLVGQGDELPDINSGDVEVVIQTKGHDSFIRKGADLYYSKKISLKEALVGVQLEILHLDGERLNVGSKKGDIIRPNQIKMIEGKGMPFFKDSMSYGNLFIQFDVEFPRANTFSESVKEQLIKILPGDVESKEQGESLDLEDFDMDKTNPNPDGSKQNENDEEGNGPQLQCAQQ